MASHAPRRPKVGLSEKVECHGDVTVAQYLGQPVRAVPLTETRSGVTGIEEFVDQLDSGGAVEHQIAGGDGARILRHPGSASSLKCPG